MGHTMYLPALYNWLQKVDTAITGRRTVRHFDALIFFFRGSNEIFVRNIRTYVR